MLAVHNLVPPKTTCQVLFTKEKLRILHAYCVKSGVCSFGEKDGGGQSFPFFMLLPFDHAVKTTDGVCFQSSHGAAFVQDKHHFCQIPFHKKPSLCFSQVSSCNHIVAKRGRGGSLKKRQMMKTSNIEVPDYTLPAALRLSW